MKTTKTLKNELKNAIKSGFNLESYKKSKEADENFRLILDFSTLSSCGMLIGKDFLNKDSTRISELLEQTLLSEKKFFRNYNRDLLISVEDLTAVIIDAFHSEIKKKNIRAEDKITIMQKNIDALYYLSNNEPQKTFYVF